MTLDRLDDVKGGDPHGVRDVLAAFPAQCREALALAPAPALPGGRPALVVVAGMGGSAASGDLLAACAEERLDVPVLVHRGYGLPAAAGPGTLVIASSYSGDTAETVSAVETALARRSRVLVVTTGGRLARLAAEHGLPCVTLPRGLMPRMALGYLFFPALGAVTALGLDVASVEERDEAVVTVAALAGELAPGRPSAENEAKRLATAIGPRLPVVYGGPTTAAVAYRWKTDAEENAKVLAFAGALPEMNHNEIEAWRAPAASGFHLVLLRDAAERPEIARRFAVLRDLVGGTAGGLSESWTRGRGRLARLLSLVYLGQWTSYYLALLRGVDPWAVPMLDEVKRRMLQ